MSLPTVLVTTPISASIRGPNTIDGRNFSLNNYGGVLAVGVVTTITVPGATGNLIAFFDFQPNAAVWVLYNSAATLAAPAGTITGSQLTPKCRVNVLSGKTIQLLATVEANPGLTTVEFCVEYYATGLASNLPYTAQA